MNKKNYVDIKTGRGGYNGSLKTFFTFGTKSIG